MSTQETKQIHDLAWNERLKGQSCLEKGRLDLALTHHMKALALFEASKEKVWVAHTHLALGTVLERAGKIERAKRRYLEAVILFEVIGYIEGSVMADTRLAGIAEMRRDRKGQRFHWNKVLENLKELKSSSVQDVQAIIDGLENPRAVSFSISANHRGAPR